MTPWEAAARQMSISGKKKTGVGDDQIRKAITAVAVFNRSHTGFCRFLNDDCRRFYVYDAG